MTILVNNEQVKKYHARSGANNVFGKDVDDRSCMNERQLIERFDQVWQTKLGPAVESAQPSETEDALKLLELKQQRYFNDDQEHRQFWVDNCLFLAQLNRVDETHQELTQLWFIRSSNADPRTLYVKFDSCDARDEFRRAAQKLGYSDEDLGKRVLTDFMETVLKH